LTKGSQVTVIGIYNDYAKIKYQNDGVIGFGFIPRKNLLELPANIPNLSDLQVSWKPLVDYTNWGDYSSENGGSLISTPLQEEQTDWVSDETLHTMVAPTRIRFGLINSSSRWGSVKLDGSPQLDRDWWKGITRMDISNMGENYSLCVRDGTSESCTSSIDLSIPSDQIISLVFSDNFGKKMDVINERGEITETIDFTQLPGVTLPGGLFPFGWFKFGTSVGPPGTLKVTHLSIETKPNGVYKPSWVDEPGLAELAANRNILIGTEFNPDIMFEEGYCTAIVHDFNLGMLSPFTDGKLWLAPGKYNFDVLDRFVNDSAKFGLTLYASHLVWGATETGVLPEWLKNGNFSKDELLKILENHIKTLVGRYKDKVTYWSIANEAPERDIYPGADFWFDHIGPEYIEKSFQWAREADPNAILVFNAANNESPRDAETTNNINRLYQMVASMKEKGIPVDVVGMQMHMFLPWTSKVIPVKEDVVATMKMFGELGVKVMITEMDVNLHELTGSPEEKLLLQTKIYGDMMSACIESGDCIAFATWGVSDSRSWINADCQGCVYPPTVIDALPLMFDNKYIPKPAYFAVRDALLSNTH
jgi:endo-1,4-beta-xylanase